MNRHTKWHISDFLPEVCSSITTAVPGKCFSNHITRKIWQIPKCLKRNISMLHDIEVTDSTASTVILQSSVSCCTYKDFFCSNDSSSNLTFYLEQTKLWCTRLRQN